MSAVERDIAVIGESEIVGILSIVIGSQSTSFSSATSIGMVTVYFPFPSTGLDKMYDIGSTFSIYIDRGVIGDVVAVGVRVIVDVVAVAVVGGGPVVAG